MEKQRTVLTGMGPWLLVWLVLQSACTSGAVGRGLGVGGADSASVHTQEVVFLEAGRTPTRTVPIDALAFRQAWAHLAATTPLQGTPQQTAQALLRSMEEELLAEVYRGRVLTLVPTQEHGALVPQAEAALRTRYLAWCEARGGGDCLGLFDDGPYLHTDDRRTLALALALGPVLDEARAALTREVLDPRALVSMAVWTVGLYLALWLVPEPTTKALAATLTVLLLAWLGADTLRGLMDGWAQLATRAQEATTFEELREAGAHYARVLGTDAARVLILAVGALTGRTLGEVAARVRSLPGASLAGAQWEAQGGAALVRYVEAGTTDGALSAAVEAVEAVAVSPQGPLAVVMLKARAGPPASGGRSSVTSLRHQGGNQQVTLSDGQRWHLPRGKSVADIPARDGVGDELQEAVTQAAQAWGPERLSRAERGAIQEAVKKGRYWLARLLEREARGRFVEKEVSERFRHLYDFNPRKGVDIIDPATGYQYEILSGTESNLARHGRRMAGEFFRMLTF
jgi:hypothetical protein